MHTFKPTLMLELTSNLLSSMPLLQQCAGKRSEKPHHLARRCFKQLTRFFFEISHVFLFFSPPNAINLFLFYPLSGEQGHVKLACPYSFEVSAPNELNLRFLPPHRDACFARSGNRCRPAGNKKALDTKTRWCETRLSPNILTTPCYCSKHIVFPRIPTCHVPTPQQ